MNKNCYKWVERYRPDHVKDVILPTAEKKFFENIVKTKQVPNLMLYSAKGRGKTSVALALINDLDAQVFKINASMEAKLDLLREDLSKFARTKNPKKTPKSVLMTHGSVPGTACRRISRTVFLSISEESPEIWRSTAIEKNGP